MVGPGTILLMIFLASNTPACDEQSQNNDTAQTPAPAHSQAGPQPRHHLIELTSSNWQPLTPYQKFELLWRDLISWETHLSLAGGAGIAYATDSRDYLGTGWQGYGKRYGINFLDEANSTFFQAFLLPALFHEEPRYIPNDRGTTKQRIFYALTRVAVARKDSGGFTVNKSKLLGEFICSGISTVYDYPNNHEIKAGDVFTRAGVNLGSDAAFNLFKEFWPDFARKVKLNVWLRSLVRSTIRDVVRVD